VLSFRQLDSDAKASYEQSMFLRPNTLGITAVMALLTAIGPLSTDLYLPSLPAMESALQTSGSKVQLTLSFYLLGFAFGQIFYGPISDRVGRKPTILAGLGLYCLASAACALASSIDVLIAARFVQAFGAAAPIVLARAMVRDMYDGARAGQELSRMGMIMGLVPAVAPVLGGILEPLFGWRSNFWAVLLAGALLTTVVLLKLPETLRERRPERISVPGILRGFGILLQNKGFRVYVLLAGFIYAGLFCFISGSSFVLQKVYGLSPGNFGLSFGFCVLGFILGTIIAQRIVLTSGMDVTIGYGVLCMAAGGVSMLAWMALGYGHPAEVVLPMTLYTVGLGLALPQVNASSMMPFPDRAGAASSLQGLIQMTFAAAVGASLGAGLHLSALLLPLAITMMGVSALLLFAVSRKLRQAA
jgi:MFS transporter, DHA1 family, multidrug resistance protein